MNTLPVILLLVSEVVELVMNVVVLFLAAAAIIQSASHLTVHVLVLVID